MNGKIPGLALSPPSLLNLPFLKPLPDGGTLLRAQLQLLQVNGRQDAPPASDPCSPAKTESPDPSSSPHPPDPPPSPSSKRRRTRDILSEPGDAGPFLRPKKRKRSRQATARSIKRRRLRADEREKKGEEERECEDEDDVGNGGVRGGELDYDDDDESSTC